MNRRYGFSFLCLVLFLCFAVSARADWEEFTKTAYLDVGHENYRGADLMEVENYFIKLLALDYDAKVAQVVISDRDGIKYYEGPISETMDFSQDGKIWVRWGDLIIKNGYPQIKFKVFLWQQLSLMDFNIPPLMNWQDEYDVYMDWKNLGDTDLPVFFEVVAQDGFVTPLNLDKNIVFQPFETKRIYFRLRPEQYVTTGPQTSVRSNLEDLSLQLLVYSAKSGNLLRRVDLGRYSLTSGPAAFIEEIVTPLLQFVGKEYEAKVRVRNSGFTQKNTGNYMQDTFTLKLEAPGFKIKDSDMQYLRMDPLTTQELQFFITPRSGGVRNIIATFIVDRKPAAALAERIVVKGAKTLLLGDLSNVPREVMLGSSYPIPVRVFNKGDFTEEVVVRLSSENFKVKSPEFVLKLPPNTDQDVVFDVFAEKEGNTDMLFEVITTSENLKITQFFKGSGIAADEKHINVVVKGPTMALVVNPPVEEIPVNPVTKPTPAEVVPEENPTETKPKVPATEVTPETKPTVPETKPPASFSLINVILLILGIIIIFVLIALIVKKASKKSGHKKKKKKDEDFELEGV